MNLTKQQQDPKVPQVKEEDFNDVEKRYLSLVSQKVKYNLPLTEAEQILLR